MSTVFGGERLLNVSQYTFNSVNQFAPFNLYQVPPGSWAKITVHRVEYAPVPRTGNLLMGLIPFEKFQDQIFLGVSAGDSTDVFASSGTNHNGKFTQGSVEFILTENQLIQDQGCNGAGAGVILFVTVQEFANPS